MKIYNFEDVFDDSFVLYKLNPSAEHFNRTANFSFPLSMNSTLINLAFPTNLYYEVGFSPEVPINGLENYTQMATSLPVQRAKPSYVMEIYAPMEIWVVFVISGSCLAASLIAYLFLSRAIQRK